ncbi:hypothetical protein N869_04010, partial [Cellulomonas bogoriensis 69B4 = DSM 16987]
MPCARVYPEEDHMSDSSTRSHEPEPDRVRAHTDPEVNQQLDDERVGSVAAMVGAPEAAVRARLADLDHEWDVERVLQVNAAALTLLGVSLGATRSRRWLALAAVVPAFLLQHAVQGWCPPLALLRRLGVRTRREIEAERTALKALRGDFDGLDGDAP